MGDGGPRRDAGQFPLSVCWLLLLAMPARGEHILGLTKVHAAAYHGEAADTSIGVNLEMLEDGPDRPTALDGSPVVSGTPADWWYDGGLTATPVFTVAGGVFEDHQNVSIFCGTIDALIIYTMADLDDADEIFSTGNYGKLVACTRYENRALNAGPVFQTAKRRYFEWAETTRID